MATQIPCFDFIESDPGPVPARLQRANPDALKNRWGNFVYAMDLSPEPDDDALGNVGGAWSLWDLPVTHAAQIDDDRGDDMIVVAVDDKVYVLDWTRYRDEWEWNAFKPIYRMLRFGPIPHQSASLEGEGANPVDAYDIAKSKLFREFYFAVKNVPTDHESAFRLSVGAWDNENITRTTVQTMTQRNRINISIQAPAFILTLEHAADEQWSPYQWVASWDVLDRQLRLNSERLA
jgi:hypothetical protein